MAEPGRLPPRRRGWRPGRGRLPAPGRDGARGRPPRRKRHHLRYTPVPARALPPGSPCRARP
ncbi:MAG: hypothetical protein FJ314_02600 [SAR202 cluster bacterium]|nr:hypothetical protein [SAR202 cluster bacterium]